MFCVRGVIPSYSIENYGQCVDGIVTSLDNLVTLMSRVNLISRPVSLSPHLYGRPGLKYDDAIPRE